AAAELADRKDMAYLGTLVTFGRATVVVTATGAGTEVGKISKLVEEAKEERTPLQQELAAFGKRLGFLIIGICVLVAVIGILRAGPLSGQPITQALVAQMAITGIALAVAAIPEGLPAVVTITLALGLQRLAKRNALMRRLAAVETLGSTSVICSDKTGTLTKNEMTVTTVWHSGTEIAVTGTGYEPRGAFLIAGKQIVPERDRQLMEVLKAGALCNNASLKRNGAEPGIIGDPTEGALVVAAAKAMNVDALNAARPRVAEIPFSGARKMMSVACTSSRLRGGEGSVAREGPRVYVKGAPEIVLERCTHILRAGREMPLSALERKKVLEANHALTLRALRVLAVAERAYEGTGRHDAGSSASRPRAAGLSGLRPGPEMEEKLVFLGLVGMIDPPR
ncbi:MAG TPA: HAD-IC family P-type ATPase, partial [archaeon]|nr:HAD-IC family P-type ATPase [archaeon]